VSVIWLMETVISCTAAAIALVELFCSPTPSAMPTDAAVQPRRQRLKAVGGAAGFGGARSSSCIRATAASSGRDSMASLSKA
jgi:hypothetical protein